MLLKTFRGGLTYKGAVAIIAYLLNQRVIEGLSKVIKGDSELTKSIILEASKKFKWSWSSGVLSFCEILNYGTMMSIIKDYERTFFCGLHRDQYNILWVLHIDKKRTELHYIAPRMELSTGKSFNPYYVYRDFGKKDIYQEYINQKWGLSSYLDNKRLVSGSTPKWSEGKQTLAEEIDEYLLSKDRNFEISSRNQIIDLLRDLDFELVGMGIDHIVILSDKGEELTLKGPIYSKDFTRGLSLLENDIKRESPPKIGIQDGDIVRESTRNFTKLERALNEIIAKQTYGNRERYPFPVPKPKQVRKQKSQTIKKDKENNNDRSREYIHRFIIEESRRAGKRKRRIAQIVELNLWAESTDYQHVTEGFEQRYRDRRFRADFEKGIREIFGNLGGIKQKLAQRNEEALGILRRKQVKRSVNVTFKMKM